MSKTIICSTGTSAAKLIRRPPRLAEWVRERGGPELAAKAIFESFMHL